jgi:glycosyltransferase involved in cell wall biosynthesis
MSVPPPTADRAPELEPTSVAAAPPRVFVVTPSFNQAAYLRATIESVLAQDYPRLDYFVADGGSTDGSVEILRGYGERVRWVSGPDGGQTAAIADAWAKSDADVVAWLNSDDTYLPGAVSSAVAHLEAHPAAGMVYGKAWFVDERGEKLRAYPTLPFDAHRLRTECFVCQPATFLRRKVFERVGLPDRTLDYCMDYDLWIRLSRVFELAYLEEFLACSRVHPETKSQRELTAVFTEIEAVTARAYGVAPRNWAVARMIHRSKLRVNRLLGFLPEKLRRRRQAAMVSRLEAAYLGTLYSDLWAGTATLVEVRADRDGRVSLPAESPYWPFDEPLEIAVELDGRELARRVVAARGAFSIDFALPPAAPRDEAVEIVLRANRTFVPCISGFAPWDERPISFMLR